MAAAKKKREPTAWDIQREREAAIAASLPRDRAALIAAAKSGTAAYHAAACAADAEGMVEHSAAVRATATALSEMLGVCWMDAGAVINDEIAAKPGTEPMFGQAGRWIVTVAGCRVDLHYGGLLNYLSTSVRVVDLDKPFVSSTGFYSLCALEGVNGGVFGTGGLTPTEWFERAIAARLSLEDNGKRKQGGPRLVMVTGLTVWRGGEKREHPYRHDDDDLAWKPGGHLYAATDGAGTPPIAVVEDRRGQLGFAF